MNNQNTKQKGRTKLRGLPFFDLRTAVERTMDLFSKCGNIPTDIHSAAAAIGYRNAYGGAAPRMLRTMKGYGLVSINHLWVTIPSSIEEFVQNPLASKKALARAWLSQPRIFGDLLDRLGSYDPPSKDCVLRELLRNEDLNPRRAEALAEIMMRSLAYANSLPDAAIPKSKPQLMGMTLPVDTFLIKLEGGRRAWVRLPPDKLTVTDRDKILSVLDLLVGV